MIAILMTALGFFLGSIPFSVWLGQLVLGKDIRSSGADFNPGAANAWRAGKWKLGVPVLLLDFLKGVLPVGLAHYGLKLTGWELVPVALAPVLGHAFSPFLLFKGGKALAVTFGIWTGLTLAEGPLVLGAILGSLVFILSVDAWALIMGMLVFLVYLVVRGFEANILAIWLGNMLVLTWKHRRELEQPLKLHPRFSRRMR